MFTMDKKATECTLPKCYKFFTQTQDKKNNKNENNQKKSGGKKGNNHLSGTVGSIPLSRFDTVFRHALSSI
jgi:hypothetical protein